MQASDEASANQKILELKILARFIIFAFVPFCIPVLLFIVLFKSIFFFIFIVFYFIFGIIIQNILLKVKCPCCKDYFFDQNIILPNYDPRHAISFPSQNKCQRCKNDLTDHVGNQE